MGHDRLSSITLHQLQLFATVARQRSFAKAADELELAQPTLSEQIKGLEQLVGVRLLERSPGRKQVELTEAGRILLQSCEEVSQSLKRAVRMLEGLQTVVRGTISVGTGLYFGGYVLPRAYEAFRRNHPGIAVRVQVDRSHHVLESLARRRIDLGVVAGTITDPDLISEPLGGYDVVLVGPPGHRLASGAPVPFHQLASEPMILPDRLSWVRKAIDRLAAETGTELHVTLEVSNIEAQMQAVVIGLGIAALCYDVVATGIAAGQLTLLRVQGLPIRLPNSLVYRRGQLSPAAMQFKEHLLEFRADMDRVSPPGLTMSLPPVGTGERKKRGRSS